MNEERRCAECGALLAASAEWCGQCLAPVKLPQQTERPAPADPPAQAEAVPKEAGEPSGGPSGAGGRPAGGKPGGAQRATAYWACPVCGEENSLDLELCPVCGTSFAKLFEDPWESPRLDPGKAAMLGLVPGLGHLRCGKAGDGIARMFVFLMSLAFLVIFISADSGKWSAAVTALYIVFCFALVAESWLDAGRVARKEPPLISTRNLLWLSLGVLGVSVGIVVMLSIGVRPEG